MSALRSTVGTAALAGLLAAGLVSPAVAGADESWGINGTFTVFSNGQWAKTNERYEDQAQVRSTWTVQTTCSSPVDCTGTVKSDQGWEAPIYRAGGSWWVKRSIPGWITCADGAKFDGLQMFRFYSVDVATGLQDPYNTNTFAGEDITSGPSGACGRSRETRIRMPWTAVRLA
ncbi:hypothetical protein LV457_18015 [Mycobacterium sp. MYCO198283]|uniref:hypothetical protein n=1 Tax=Mycobacterium sp. MYCO198283 TaxID=2883505 RepID=UPI001E43BDE4|nr:hypothetical protein [Mycobacterium sp. MYCO198283]MCG5434170.1 hypothetical protein [Mycobacterium sp. MYCO198283]